MGPQIKWLQGSNLRHGSFPSTALNDQNATTYSVYEPLLEKWLPRPGKGDGRICFLSREGRTSEQGHPLKALGPGPRSHSLQPPCTQRSLVLHLISASSPPKKDPDTNQSPTTDSSGTPWESPGTLSSSPGSFPPPHLRLYQIETPLLHLPKRAPCQLRIFHSSSITA